MDEGSRLSSGRAFIGNEECFGFKFAGGAGCRRLRSLLASRGLVGSEGFKVLWAFAVSSLECFGVRPAELLLDAFLTNLAREQNSRTTQTTKQNIP